MKFDDCERDALKCKRCKINFIKNNFMLFDTVGDFHFHSENKL